MPPKSKKTAAKRAVKCFVPLCENVEGCGKIFIHTPRNPAILRSWCDAVGVCSGGKCCEDHFELSEDAENWQYFKLCGSGLKIRKGVVPHKYLTSKRPDPCSQFSDSDKKLKLEFLSALANERKITRVNRLTDLQIHDGSTELNELEQLTKHNARTKYNEPPTPVSTLQVTPDIYLCTCVHDQPVLHNLVSNHLNSCSTQTHESEYFILGPTTDVPVLEDLPQVPATTSSRSRKKSSRFITGEDIQEKPKRTKSLPVESEDYDIPSESDLSIFDGDYSDVDPDYDPDSEGRDYDREHQEPPLSELKEDDLIKNALKSLPSDEARTSKRLAGKRKSTPKRNQKTVKAPPKSTTTNPKTNNVKKPTNQKLKGRPKKKR